MIPLPNSGTDKPARYNLSEDDGGAPWRVLFVGADPLWFVQIKRDLGCLQPGWLCVPSSGVRVGPVNSEWQAADALVVEAQVAGTREWVEKVRKVRPDIPCLVRCDLADKTVVDGWKGLGYPMVSSQSDASTLAASMMRNTRLREWMADPAIKRILPLIRKLPATPRLYTQVTEELRSENGSLEVVAHLIRQDPVMSAKMLQLVNSAFFASAHEVSDMLDAAMMLGTERIKSLILLAGVFSQYDKTVGVGLSIEAVLSHSIQVGVYARAIALSETKDAGMAEAAFTAGILHDMGKMMLAGNLPERYKEVRELSLSKGISHLAAEFEVFGVTHAQVGACLLASWGLPLSILEAVAWHHDPTLSHDRSFSLLAAVHAANAFAHGPEGMPDRVQQEYFERIGLPDGCQRWSEMFGLVKLVAA